MTNDAVEVIAGEFKGIKGALITPKQVEPTAYLVKPGDGGGDLLVVGSHLRCLDHDEEG